MALNGVKNNKCFEPVVKYTGTVTIYVPSSTTTPRTQSITNSAISSGDVVIVTPYYEDSAIQDGSIIYWTSVTNGIATVYMRATDNDPHEITFNVAVLAGASSE
jgi:hypothetical protein